MAHLTDEDLIALLHLPGVGRRTVAAVLRFSERAGYDGDLASLSRFARSEGIRLPVIEQSAVHEAMERAKRSVDAVLSHEGVVVSLSSDSYPPLLRSIPNPPLMLFMMGNVEALRLRPTVAVVGTREPSTYGQKWGRRVAQVFGAQGYSIVSGLAEGCDTVGHAGALDVGAPTVAILAHGFGRIYPRSNAELAETIVHSGGCLVTEYLPGEPPRRSSFVERDRLQSGASLGVVVVETDIEGGTMHTVGFAQEQRRILAALDHPVSLRALPKSRGNQRLIGSGQAMGIGSKEDLEKLLARLGEATSGSRVTVSPSVGSNLRFNFDD